MSGPGTRLRRRNSRAAVGVSWRYDRSKAPATRRSPAVSASSRRSSRASRSASLRRLQPVRVASQLPATLRASGRCPQSRATSARAAGSAAARSSPTRQERKAADSAVPRPPRGRRCTLSRPVSMRRLVTSTSARPVPGSNGRTWASSRALSRTSRHLRSASTCRYRAGWAGAPALARSRSGTPSALSTPTISSAGAGGVSSVPRRSTTSCPSGKRSASRRAARRARLVLPVPGAPETATTTGWRVVASSPPVRSPGDPASSVSRSSSPSRPTKSSVPRGKERTPKGWYPGVRPVRAAASRRSRSVSSSPRPSARAATVRRCGAARRPRSRSPMPRTLTPEASASPSMVSELASRSPRSSAPNDASCADTAHPFSHLRLNIL